MFAYPNLSRRLASIHLAGVFAMALAACGGGGDSGTTSPTTPEATVLSADQTQGYSADSSVVPTTTASGIDAVVTTLETALQIENAIAPASVGVQTSAQAALALVPSSVNVSVACPVSGSIGWTISGGTLASRINSVLDTGEAYDIVFDSCTGTTPGLVLNGHATLKVNMRSDLSNDLSLTLKTLALVTPLGRFVLDGDAQVKRSQATNDSSTAVANAINASNLSLTATLGTRQAGYTLNTLNWTVTRSFNAQATLTGRSHQGTLELMVGTSRRPATTLLVATEGNLALDAGGAIAQGSFSIKTGKETVNVVYGSSSVTISLDTGSDGIIDNSWILTLPQLDALVA